MYLMLTRQPKRLRRKGYTLVIFAMLLFALFGLAALVIDLGLVRLTQRQMQTAVDSAALEGLRGRDRTDIANPDVQRRQDASELVSFVFDDDLDTNNGDARNFGAGPRINLTGGIPLSPEFNASPLITIPDSPVYDPRLQLNLDDDPSGDMVGGTFTRPASDLASVEASDYTRTDFQASDNDDSFLVRVRRTNETLSDGVGSSGGALPFLFGRGSLLASDFKGRGVAIRAAAIAQGQPAKGIGRSDRNNDLAGALALVFDEAVWNADLLIATDTPVELTVAPTGFVTSGAVFVGYAVEAGGASNSWSLGESAGAVTVDPNSYLNGLLASTPAGKLYGYVPIVRDGASNSALAGRIIGFGLVEIAPQTGNSFRVTKRNLRIAAENASPVLIRPLESIYFDSAADPELVELWQHHRDLQSPLLTSSLVR